MPRGACMYVLRIIADSLEFLPAWHPGSLGIVKRLYPLNSVLKTGGKLVEFPRCNDCLRHCQTGSLDVFPAK